MDAGKIINKIVRVLLLAISSLALLIYLLGITSNVLGWLNMRQGDEKILGKLQKTSGERAFMSSIPYKGGTIAYAGVRSMDQFDSIAVFFVHGSPGSLDACLDYLADSSLQSHAAVYAYDRLGYGHSTPHRAATTLAEHSDQLYALVSAIGAKKNIFVGHSLGCSIIAKFAMDHPTMAQGLVMVAAPIDPDLEPSSWWRPLFHYPMLRIAIPQSMQISNIELAPLKKDLQRCLPFWDRVQCPVTFIHGDIDNLVPIGNVAFGEKMLVHSSDFRKVILPGHGHFIMWSHVNVISGEIVRMITGQDVSYDHEVKTQ